MADFGFVFMEDTTTLAESWHRDDSPHDVYYSTLWSGDDDDRAWEHDYLVLGLNVADAMHSENAGPEYRRWEREHHIAWLARG